MERHTLSTLPKDIIIDILVRVNESYRLSNYTVQQLEQLQERVEEELSKRIIRDLQQEWMSDDAFADLHIPIEQLQKIEKKRDSWHIIFTTPEIVEVYVYPCTKNLFFISDKYSELQRYKLFDELNHGFIDVKIMQLVQTAYSLGYLNR